MISLSASLTTFLTPDILRFDDKNAWDSLSDDFYERVGLEPSTVTKFRDAWKASSDEVKSDAFESESKFNNWWDTNVSVAGKASAFFGLGKASANVNTSVRGSRANTELEKRNASQSLKTEEAKVFEAEGNIKIPVGFQIFRVSKANFDNERKIAIRNERTRATLTTTTTDLSTTEPMTWRVIGFHIDKFGKEEHAAARAHIVAMNAGFNVVTNVPPAHTPSDFRILTLDLRRGKLVKLITIPSQTDADRG